MSASTASSNERTAAPPPFLERYNFNVHGSLGHQPRASRLTNAPGSDT